MLFDEKKMMDELYKTIVDSDIPITGKTFTEKEVVGIILLVASMTGDPAPGNNMEFYEKCIAQLGLTKPLEEHLFAALIAARQALKKILKSSMPPELLKLMSIIGQMDKPKD